MGKFPFQILGVEHIGIATNNDSLNNFFKNILGMDDISIEIVENQDVSTEIFNTGKGKLELLKPMSKNSPISKFLRNKGQAVHHIALCVDDISNALKHLKGKGVKLIDQSPKIGAEGHLIAFIHPHESPGLLIELCQKK